MSKLDERYSILPDGRQFAFWDCETEFTKTYYVSKADNACDCNPGTKEQPFATINKAAQVLMPGERVVIGGGVYDEFVQPARGGEGPAKMISYEAAPGERVVITGAREFKNGWRKPIAWAIQGRSYRREPGAPALDEVIFEGRFTHDDFDLVNPFSMVNHPSHPWETYNFYIANAPKGMDWKPLFQRRGLLFCDGEKLTQVSSPRFLTENPGSYWVEDSGFKFLVYLKDGSNPADHVITFTCREQLFAPSVEGTSYVRVSGLEFEFVGNGVPGTQKGALSTYLGHHWIIENNKVRWANSIGIDIGQESTVRTVGDWITGGTIVRGNHVSHCGICGIAGVPGGVMANESILIEFNTLENCCWQDFQNNYESAAIKVHLVRNGLIRFNTILNTEFGGGIWTDFANRNERVCYNFIMNCKSTIIGAIFVEASDVLNRVDHNVICDCKSHWLGEKKDIPTRGASGILVNFSDNSLVEENIIFGMDCDGISIPLGSLERICNGHSSFGVGHRVLKNIIAHCARGYAFPTEKNFSDGNIMDEQSFAEYPIAIEYMSETRQRFNMDAAARFYGWEKNGRTASIQYSVDLAAMKVKFDIKYKGNVMTKEIAIGQPYCLEDVFAFTAEA